MVVYGRRLRRESGTKWASCFPSSAASSGAGQRGRGDRSSSTAWKIDAVRTTKMAPVPARKAERHRRSRRPRTSGRTKGLGFDIHPRRRTIQIRPSTTTQPVSRERAKCVYAAQSFYREKHPQKGTTGREARAGSSGSGRRLAVVDVVYGHGRPASPSALCTPYIHGQAHGFRKIPGDAEGVGPPGERRAQR